MNSMPASAGAKTVYDGPPSTGVTVIAYCVMALWRSPVSAGGGSSHMSVMESFATLTMDAAGRTV